MGAGRSFPITRLSKDRVVLVTGANAGLGYEISKWTAMMGATVIMACRSEARAKQAINRMNAEFREEKTKGTVGISQDEELALEVMIVDLSSFKSVTNFVQEYQKSGRPLHVLFCNAGEGFEEYAVTEDGLEEVFQVNYLSHFLMVTKLLPVMKRSGPDCRLLFMSSPAHKVADFDINTLNYAGSENDYAHLKYYARSKLYQIMQMYCMDRRLQGSNIAVNIVYPPLVDSNFYDGADVCYIKCALCCGKTFCFAQTPARSARCSIDCTTNPKLHGVSGIVFYDFKRVTPSREALNETYQELLWNKSFEFLSQYVDENDIAAMEGK